MMQYFKYPERSTWLEITRRPPTDILALEKTVRKILKNVKEKGDKAVLKYTKKFDRQSNVGKVVLTDELKQAIWQGKLNIEKFHATQREEIKQIETMPGISCWRRSLAIEKVGLYIPGGTATLFSTVLMLGIPAKLAGCKEIILCSPSIDPAILYAAELCGISKIFKVGGAQAIAAMAYGTETIPKVFKIFGPGNQYVTLAKQLVQLEGIAIDMPAGPSELLIIADETAIPEFVAADLLSQAEHGEDSQVILVTPFKKLAREVGREIKRQLKQLPRKDIAEKAFANSRIILVKDLEEAIDFSNQYAPEHLMLCCSDAGLIAKQIISAGSVFIGNYSPESAGDYASGTNHCLPTNGYAAVYSGVSLDSFEKKITYQQLTKSGLQNIGKTIMTMAEAEGLDGHKNAIAIRL